jgi:hypothetical protein
MLSTLDVKGTYTFCLTKFQTIPVAMHATKNWAHAACFIGAFFFAKIIGAFNYIAIHELSRIRVFVLSSVWFPITVSA